MKPKTKELIKNLTQTISKESKKVNGKNEKLIEILQNKLDKIKWTSFFIYINVINSHQRGKKRPNSYTELYTIKLNKVTFIPHIRYKAS